MKGKTKGLQGKIKGTKAEEGNERLRGNIKGADSAKGENRIHEGFNKMCRETIKDYGEK